MFAATGKDGREFALRYAELTLVAGTITDLTQNLLGWYPVGLVRRLQGAGALGELTATIDGTGRLTIASDAATDVSTVVVLLAQGGGTRI
jgi:hypothetical protein